MWLHLGTAADRQGVTVFVEGKKNPGRHLGRFAAHRDALAADVTSSPTRQLEHRHPGLTVSLRGSADCVVEAATLDHGLHSNRGGVVPDALTVLVRLAA